jgi:hypothetical protein
MTDNTIPKAPTSRRLIGVLQIIVTLGVLAGGVYWMKVVSDRANAAYSTSAPASSASQ